MVKKRTPTLEKNTPLYPYPLEIVEKLETKTTRAGMSRPYKARRTDVAAMQAKQSQSSLIVVKIADVDQEHGEFINTALQREERILRSLNHPSIVKLLAIPAPEGHPPFTQPVYSARLETQGKPWFILLEYIGGKSLRDHWDSYVMGVLEPQQRLLLMQNIASALEMIHALGWAHLDIKPENILFRTAPSGNQDVQPVLIDFGIAERIGEPPDGEAGTIAYMSPERLRSNQTVRVEMDTWALGVIFYQMLTGRHPFAQDGKLPPDDDAMAWSRLLETHQPLPPTSLAKISDSATVNRKVDALVLRMLARNPSDRGAISTVSSQLADIQHLWPEPTIVEPPSICSWVRSSPLRAASAIIGVLLLALLVWGIVSVVQYTPDPSALPSSPGVAQEPAGQQPPLLPAPTATPTPVPTSTAAATPLPTPPPLTPGAAYAFPGERTALYMPGRQDSTPSVQLSPYFIMDSEVTNQQYKACMDAGACTMPRFADPQVWDTSDEYDSAYAAHPVTGVDAEQAAAYATWAGGSLPSAAQWQEACNGGDEERVYPWGGGTRPDGSDEAPANVGSDRTQPIAQFNPPGVPYALWDIIGNVWEWASTEDGGYSLRGGSWKTHELDARCNYAVPVVSGELSKSLPAADVNGIEAGEVGFRVVWPYGAQRELVAATPTPVPTATPQVVYVPTPDRCPQGAECLTLPPKGFLELGCFLVSPKPNGKSTIVSTWIDLADPGQNIERVNTYLFNPRGSRYPEDVKGAADKNLDRGNVRTLSIAPDEATTYAVRLINDTEFEQPVEVRLDGFEPVSCP
jgi:serine/threonine protein kinase